MDETFEQAVADGCEGLLCKSVGPTAVYQAGARGWLWIKLKRDYRTELADTVDLVVVGAFAGRGRRRGLYGALLLAAYDPATDTFRTVGKCGTGFSDAEWPRCPPGWRRWLDPSGLPGSTPANQPTMVRTSLVLEVLSAELTLSPNHTAGWGQVKADTGLAMRFPRFTGRWRDDKTAWTPPPLRNSSTCTAPRGGRRPVGGATVCPDRGEPHAVVPIGGEDDVRRRT